jgi:hypothetical protein
MAPTNNEKNGLLKRHTGVTWVPHGDGRIKPRFKWKSIQWDGEPRHYQGFYQGEREAVLKYFACRVAEHLFGASPITAFELSDGNFTMEDNPEWDKLPCVVTDPDTGMPVMDDGSELITP